MCNQIETIAKNCHGKLCFCKGKNKYHLYFNNIYIELTKRELKSFQKFLSEIDVEYWESKYDCQVMKRKIPIPTFQQNLLLMFNKEEIVSLKNLVFLNTPKPFENLSPVDIDYLLFLN